MLQRVALVAEDSYYPLLKSIPNMIYVFSIIVLLSQTLFIASVIYEITKQKEAK